MKGVILAGGSGTRLRPTTRVVNKHVIPIYDEPMIYYPVRTLLNAGVDDIMVISNADHIGKYIQLLEEETEFDANFSYKVQSEAKGIAHGVAIAEDFVEEKVAVMLGDNIVIDDMDEEISSFRSQDEGAKIFVTQVNEPSAFGVASIDGDTVTNIQEKPQTPESNYAVVGLYLYNSSVFSKIEELEPSERGEYEITDVNKQYVNEATLKYEEINGKWFDAGTPEGLHQAAQSVREEKGIIRDTES